MIKRTFAFRRRIHHPLRRLHVASLDGCHVLSILRWSHIRDKLAHAHPHLTTILQPIRIRSFRVLQAIANQAENVFVVFQRRLARLARDLLPDVTQELHELSPNAITRDFRHRVEVASHCLLNDREVAHLINAPV